jgi:hypothetical protein
MPYIVDVPNPFYGKARDLAQDHRHYTWNYQIHTVVYNNCMNFDPNSNISFRLEMN